MNRYDTTIQTDDGRELAATVFEPDTTPRACLVINSALAVSRGFYARFAAWFADRGFAALTYDWRGTGESAPADLRTCEARLEDWADHDIPAALRYARHHFDCQHLYVVGHSMGGQIMGLLGDRCAIDGMATFSAQSGHWRLQYPGWEWKLWATMTVLVPTLTRVLGYLPWSAFFGGEDIPSEAALQWARWCRDPEYLMGDPDLDAYDRFGRFTAPILAYSFDDDEWGYHEAVDWMMDQYVHSEVQRRHIVPDDVGVDAIGHFGFFKRGMEPLWEELGTWFGR